MTQNEVYDLACAKLKEPAVVMMGSECVIGEWVSLAEYNEFLCVLTSKTRGVRVLGRGASWAEAVADAGLDSLCIRSV